ncbi:MAG: phytanoyl-CoA dioxygenase family protein [Puniceicoccales bacterium]
MITDTQQLKSLSESQWKDYHEKGFVHLKSVYNADDIAALNAECDRLLDDRDLLHEENWRTPFRKFPLGVWRLDKIDPVIDISEVVNRYVHDSRLLDPVSDCLGDEASLLKDKIIFKGPGQTGFDPHQDWTWWQPFPQDMLSAMVAIDGADASNGALEVYPSKHQEYLLPLGELRPIKTPEELGQFDEHAWQMIETEPGDVILFHCLTPHRSGTNVSDKSRRQMYLTYNAAKHGDLYEAHYKHYEAYVTANLNDFFKPRQFFR